MVQQKCFQLFPFYIFNSLVYERSAAESGNWYTDLVVFTFVEYITYEPPSYGLNSRQTTLPKLATSHGGQH